MEASMRKSNYGFFELAKNAFYVVKTKLFFSGARLIRFPIIVRWKKYIDFATNLVTGYRC